MSGVQETRAQDYFRVQHAAQAQAAFDFRREKGGLYRFEENPQGRIRTAMNCFDAGGNLY